MKSKTKVSIVREAFETKRHATLPKGRKAGQAVRAGIVIAAATVVSGLGSAYGAVTGFGKGLIS